MLPSFPSCSYAQNSCSVKRLQTLRQDTFGQANTVLWSPCRLSILALSQRFIPALELVRWLVSIEQATHSLDVNDVMCRSDYYSLPPGAIEHS